MEHETLAGRIFRGVALTLIVIFFMFPIVWILLMSFQTNEQILRIPPRILFEPTLANYEALISGELHTAAGNLEILGFALDADEGAVCCQRSNAGGS